MQIKVPMWAVAIVVVAALAAGAVWGYGQVRYSWDSSWKAQGTHAWLTQEIGKTDKGQVVTRAMLIDALLQQSLKQQPSK